MNDLAPMLHQEIDNAPMLGGDRRIDVDVPCPVCERPMVRDFFGKYFCPAELANEEKLKRLRENPVCPSCGETNVLSLERMAVGPDYGTDGIVWVFCECCDTTVWISDRGYTSQHPNMEFGYLAPGGKVEPYE